MLAGRSTVPGPEVHGWRRSRVARWATREKALVLCLVLALVAHLPMMPFSRYLGGIFEFNPDEVTEEDDEPAIIPVEIDISGELPDRAEKTAPTAPPPAPPPPEPEATTPPAPPVPAPEPEPPPPPKPKRESPADEIDDVKKLNKNPNNVTITLVGSQLRQHPVGAKMGALLADNAQWEGFFAGSNIDPVKDIEVMVITGPRMRISGQVISILKFTAGMDRVREAVDRVVVKGGGEWLEGAPIPAARASAEGHERVFALVPDKSLLYVFPSSYPDAKKRKRLKKSGGLEAALANARKAVDKELEKIKSGTFAERATPEFAIEAYMVEPWKLQGSDGKVDLPVVGGVELIPKNLDQARLTVVPQGGDADVSLTLVAANVREAIDDAKVLNSTWAAVQLGARYEYKIDLPDLTFETKGNTIVAQARLSQAALEAAFGIGQKMTAEEKRKAEERKSKKTAKTD